MGPTKFTEMIAAHIVLRPLTSSAGRVARSAHAVAASESCTEAATRIAVCCRWLSSLQRCAITPLVHLDARARMKRSRRFRASIIVSSTARSSAACRLSSRMARTISATRPGGTLPSSSTDNVAVIPACICLLSLVAWLARNVLVRGAAQRRLSLTKVVGGVVVWTRVCVSRQGYPCWFDRSGWPRLCGSVSYTHLRAHETVLDLVCRLLLEKKKKT